MVSLVNTYLARLILLLPVFYPSIDLLIDQLIYLYTLVCRGETVLKTICMTCSFKSKNGSHLFMEIKFDLADSFDNEAGLGPD